MEKRNLTNKKEENDIKKEIIKLADNINHKTLAVWAIDCAEIL